MNGGHTDEVTSYFDCSGSRRVDVGASGMRYGRRLEPVPEEIRQTVEADGYQVPGRIPANTSTKWSP